MLPTTDQRLSLVCRLGLKLMQSDGRSAARRADPSAAAETCSSSVVNKSYITREHFPHRNLVANFMKMSLTCYNEISCVGHVHEDATRKLRGNCSSGIYA